jgi:hypothetical protein
LGNRRITIADRQTSSPPALTIGAYARPIPIQTGGEVIDLDAAQVTATGPQRRTASPSLVFFTATATVRLANRAPAGCSCPASKIFYESKRAEGKLHTGSISASSSPVLT